MVLKPDLTFINVADINGTYRFDDTAKFMNVRRVVNKELSALYPANPGDPVRYRPAAEATIDKLVGRHDERTLRPYLPEPHPTPDRLKRIEKQVRKDIADHVLCLYPVHLQIRARAANASAALRELSEEVAAEANDIVAKFKDGPVFPSAIESIKALQAHATANPHVTVRNSLFTFGGDGPETWKILAEKTGLKLDGVGKFNGHVLEMEDGRVLRTPQEIYELLKSGNFVLVADFAHWGRQAKLGKLVPFSADPHVIMHFKDDNLYKDVAAPVRLHADGTYEHVPPQELIDSGEMVDVNPLAFAKDLASFTRAINKVLENKGWEMRLPLPAEQAGS